MVDLSLASWREQTAALHLSERDLAGFRADRDDMFRTHPQSPVVTGSSSAPGSGTEAHPATDFAGLLYFPGPSAYSCEVTLAPAHGSLDVDTGGEDGVIRYDRVGRASTPWGELTVFWIHAYGGGLFLPFRDTSPLTYGGGRYLTDTVKGTFGRGLELLSEDRVRLDFDYAYNPSCAYDSRWACPLAPVENRLEVPIEAGEQVYEPPSRGTISG